MSSTEEDESASVQENGKRGHRNLGDKNSYIYRWQHKLLMKNMLEIIAPTGVPQKVFKFTREEKIEVVSKENETDSNRFKMSTLKSGV
jgi:hypothetical protein